MMASPSARSETPSDEADGRLFTATINLADSPTIAFDLADTDSPTTGCTRTCASITCDLSQRTKVIIIKVIIGLLVALAVTAFGTLSLDASALLGALLSELDRRTNQSNGQHMV